MPIRIRTVVQRRCGALIVRTLPAVWILLLAAGCCHAQAAGGAGIEQGQTLIRHYNSRDYGASAQNWAVLQDRRGMLYVGNNECLLEFDGHAWQRIPGTNGGVFSLAADTAGVVYVGGAGDFGYLHTDANGTRRYVSLCEQLPASARNFGVVRSVHLLGDTVFFQSRQYLFLYAGERLDILPLADSYLRAFAVSGQYFLKTAGAGLCRWQDKGLRLLPGGEGFRTETIAFLLPYQKNQLLVGTQKNGIWAYDPATGARSRPPGFETLAKRLQTEELYHGLQMPDGGYALATLGGGIYLTQPGGALKRHIHRTLGLHDNTVHHLFLDRQQGLWAAMNHGLDRISLQAPFQFWDAGLGLDAAVLCIKRHRGVLYAGTNLGLYALRPASAPSRFQRVDETLRDQVFALEEALLPGETQPRLLLATGSGVYALQGRGRLTRLPGANLGPFYSLAVSRRQAGALYAAGNNGLFRLVFRQGSWQTPERIGAANMLVRSVAEDREGRIWIGIRNRGWARLRPGADGNFEAVFFEQLNGRQAVGDHRIFSWGDALLFRSSQLGAFRFDEGKNAFQPVYFSETQAHQQTPAWVAATGPARNVWIWAPSADGAQLQWLREKKAGGWTRVYQPFGILPDVRDLFQGGFYPENEQVAWMGGAMGLYRFDAGQMPDTSYFQQPFSVLLRRVQLGADSLLAADWLAVPDKKWTLSHRTNTVVFGFAALVFERPENTRYQFLLEGYDRQWSAWTNKTEKEYTNLPPGTYRFRVQARNAFAEVAGGGDFSFTVLPPWYQSGWAYLLYLLLFGSGLFGLVRLLTRQQARRLQREQQINEQLRNADKLKDQFLANTSHELRTPLNGIIGLSESLLDGVGRFPADKQREELSLIISSGRRLAALVNDLLDFSKLKEKDLQLRLVAVDLQALTDVVLQICRPLVQDKALRLFNEVPGDLAVLADEDRLQQILLNLVGNAVKFTDRGSVRVSARMAPGQTPEPAVEIAVQDSGIGIAREHQTQIFEAFQQADGSIERQFGGTGLGLAISKSLVELHGGRIWVESERGQGATFFFTLPPANGLTPKPAPLAVELLAGAPPEKIATPPPTAPERQPPAGDLVRILIVDDEPINHHVLRNHLENGPFHLASAMNGEEALGLLENGASFDLVLLDVMMPRMSGYEVCRRIRDKYLPSELPIIMITAKNQVQDLVQGLALGANDYLAKPFSKEEFLARVHTQLDLHRIFDVTARFVPNEFIRALGYERLTEVKLGDHTQREVTVLFSDIRGYTGLSENMTPEENFQFVNTYNGRMGPLIRKNKGFVNQYLGDGIMAIFPQDAEQALQAAIEMQSELQAYNRLRQAGRQAPIRVGMGLHCGPLIMGITGDDARLDAATVSDTVNTASRIESLTFYYGVNILLSEDTLTRIPGRGASYRLRYLGMVQVKGKRQPVGIYECFNGDEPQETALKSATLDLFEQGVADFFQRRFAEAGAAFEAVLQRHPQDLAALLFVEKCRRYAQHGVPDDWTGVEKMEIK